MANTSPGGLRAITTNDYPTVDVDAIMHFQDLLDRNDMSAFVEKLDLDVSEPTHETFALLDAIQEILDSKIKYTNSDIIRDEAKKVIRLLVKYKKDHSDAHAVYTENVKRAISNNGPAVSIASMIRNKRANRLIGSPSEVDNASEELSAILSEEIEETSKLSSELSEEVYGLQLDIDQAFNVVPVYPLSILGDFDYLAHQVSENSGYPNTECLEAKGKAQQLLEAENPDIESFREAIDLMADVKDQLYKAARKASSYRFRIEEAVRQEFKERLTNDNLPTENDIDSLFVEAAHSNELTSQLVAIKMKITAEFTPKRSHLETQAGLKMKGSILDPITLQEVADLTREIEEEDTKLTQEFNELRERIISASQRNARILDNWFIDEDDELNQVYLSEELDKDNEEPVTTFRDIFHSRAAQVVAGLASFAFSATVFASALSSMAIVQSTNDDNEPDIAELANATTLDQYTETAEPSIQSEPAAETIVAQTTPEQSRIEATSPPITRTSITTRVTSSSNQLDTSQAILTPLEAGEFDMSTITNPPVADPNSAAGDLSRTAFTNGSYTPTRPDIEGPTRLVVATADKGPEGRLIVRSPRNNRPISRFNQGEQFTAEPWIQDGQPVTQHYEGYGEVELFRVQVSDENGRLTYGYIPNTYVHTIQTTASITTEQSVDNFMLDLFQDQLASETAPETDTELASMLDQLDEQIQMPDAKPVIPDHSQIPALSVSPEIAEEGIMTIDDSDIISEEEDYALVSDSDIVEEVFILDDQDLIEVADNQYTQVPFLEPKDLEMEMVENTRSTTFEGEVIPAKPMQRTQEAKGFFAKATQAAKRGFKRLFG
jgi:hypothetical protein